MDRRAETLRVLTWNLWWRFGPWEERQPAILATLRSADADLVCLQEVWATEDGDDQAAALASGLGFHHCRSRAPFWKGVSFGNALLSRWPILSSETVALPGAGGAPSPRTALLATVDAPGGPVTVVVTHLEYRFDLNELRAAQLAAICDLVDGVRPAPESSFPVIVAGDLNALPDSDEMRRMLGRSAPHRPGLVFHDAWEVAGDGTAGHTWSSRNPHLVDATWPNRRIDYVLVSWPRPKDRGTPVACRIVGDVPVDDVMPSDHFAVVADLRNRVG